MDPREDKLPMWVRQLLSNLCERAKSAIDPLVSEIAKLRPQMELLKRRNEALIELLNCAAKGGHATAHEIMEIIRAYNLTLTKHEGE